MRRDSKGGHILYLMVHVPFVWWWKIGITGQSAAKRARSIDGQMFGFPFPVFFVIIPGAYHVEQWLHCNLKALNVRFTRASGKSEWFWFPAAAFAFPVMAIFWGLYAGLFWLIITIFSLQNGTL